MKTFLRLLQFSRPYHHYVPEYLVYILLYTIFGLLNFVFLMPLFDALFNIHSYPTVTELPHFTFSVDYFKNLFYYELNYYIVRSGKFGILVFVCAILFACTLLKNLFGFLAQKVLTRMRVTLVKNLREDLHTQYTTQSLSFYHNERKGDLLSVVSSDVVEIENSVVSSVQTIFREPFTLVATFCFLFYLSKELTFFTLVFFPISGFLISTISKKLKKKSTLSQQLLGNIMNVTEETISGIRIIKAFVAEKFVLNQFRKENNEFSKTTKFILNQRELASPLSEVLGVLVVVIMIVYGGNLILTGRSNLTASAFITYIALYLQIITPAKNIAGAISYLQRGLSAGERVIRILDTPNDIKESPDARGINGFTKAITFRDVTFSYNDQQDVLNHINLDIEKGKVVALVGSSGAGKSTMADMIPRFYDVTAGSILIDGQDIRELHLKDLRGLISIVSQEAILFNDTAFNNIAFGMDHPDKEAVIRAARAANAHNFIVELENG
ncbi:ABC transporter related, partial [Russula earlei]